MLQLEEEMNRQLRMKVRKIQKMKREATEAIDYFKELVFLIEELLTEENKED